MLTENQSTLLTQLSATWPATLKISLTDAKPAKLQSHPLGQEILALAEARTASLPYFRGNKDEVAWFTLAPDDQAMRGAVEDLRAWIMPSFAWEDPREPWSSQEKAAGHSVGSSARCPLPATSAGRPPRATLGVLSKNSGKCEPSSRRGPSTPSSGCLPSSNSDRRLGSRSPPAIATRPMRPSRPSTGAELDSADNTLFMRIRLWSRFGDFTRIVDHPDLERLVSLRMPQRVRLSILEAFHEQLLAPLEETHQTDEACKLYACQIHDKLFGLISLTGSGDSLPARRLQGYSAFVRGDARQAREVLGGTADAVLVALLGTLAMKGEEPPPSQESQFLDARKRIDWKAVQELGESLIIDHPEYAPILLRSLEFRPNQSLRSALDELQNPASAAAESGSAPATPRNWPEWLALLRTGDSAALESFLEDREPEAAESLGPLETQRLCDALEELNTDPAVSQDARLRRMLLSGLVEMVDDFVKELGLSPCRPRRRLLRTFSVVGQLEARFGVPPGFPGAPRTRGRSSAVRAVR